MAKSGVDTRQLGALVRRIDASAKNAPRELSQALATGRRGARTEGSKAGSAVYNVSSRRLLQDLTTTGDGGKLSFTLTARGRPISAASYGGKQTKKGYRIKVMRGGPVTVLRRGFTQRGVPLQREGAKRYPIRGIAGPSAPDIIANPKVSGPVETAVGNRLLADLERRVTRLAGG